MTWLKMDRRGAADRRNYCRIHTGSAQAIPAEEYVSGTKSREASMSTAIRREWRKKDQGIEHGRQLGKEFEHRMRGRQGHH